MKKLAGVLLAVLLAVCLSSGVFAVEIEQIQAVMPHADIYLYDDQLDSGSMQSGDISVYLDQNSLEVVSLARASASGQGTFYVYLLDVSASIRENYFWDVRQAILNNHYRLGENDSMALIAFGDEVRVVLSGGESYDEVEMAIDELECRDMTTHFYDALNTLIELCGNVEGKRKTAIVISDGVNDAEAGVGKTRTETLERLKNAGIALNGLCVDAAGSTDHSDDNIDEFASLVRMNGGELYMFGTQSADDAASALDRFFDAAASCWLLKVRAASNIADGLEHSFRVSIGDASDNYGVILDRWEPDTEAPYVISAVYNSERAMLDIEFSEPVTGFESESSYDLTNSENEHVPFAGVLVSGTTASLAFSSLPINGTYTLTISDLTDISMEKNPLSTTAMEIVIDSGAVPEEDSIPLWVWLAAGGALLIAAVVIVLVIRSRKAPVMITPPEYRPDEAGRIRIKPGSGTRVGVELADGRGWQQYFELSVGSSVFVGRGEENDVIIDFDMRVSAQHFCLEFEDGILYVTDLGSTNGTLLNNIAIKPDTRHRLDIGDIIRFGDGKMTIRAIAG